MNKDCYQVFAGKKDLAALGFLIVLSLLAWALHSFGDGQTYPTRFHIQVFTDSKKEFDLLKPPENRFKLPGRLGIVELEWDERGRVRIASSPCPCKTCVNMGWVTNSSLICVPGGIIVEPRSSADNIDAVSR